MKMRFAPAASSGRCGWIFVIAACTLSLLGCRPSQEAAVSGTVTFDGQPLDTGTISFYPVGKGPIGYGNIQSDGRYSIRTTSRSGIPAGEYIVTVVVYADPPPVAPGRPEKLPKSLTPVRYAEKSKSDLHYRVKPGSNTIDVAIPAEEDDGK